MTKQDQVIQLLRLLIGAQLLTTVAITQLKGYPQSLVKGMLDEINEIEQEMEEIG